MTDNEQLQVVKQMLFGTDSGTFRDAMLTAYINEVKDFMKHAGVKESVINAESSVGVLALGVSDLWNYQSGGVKFSEYFKQRVIQLTRADGMKKDKELKRYTDYIKTASTTSSVIFDIPEYDAETDAAPNVYVNGMLSVSGVDYEIDGHEINFTVAKIAGTEIFVVVEKLVEVEKADV
jgi:hypothetical protein